MSAATIAAHYPAGPWGQPRRFLGGLMPPKVYTGFCACGHVFHGGNEALAQQAWAQHLAATLALDAPAPPGAP